MSVFPWDEFKVIVADLLAVPVEAVRWAREPLGFSAPIGMDFPARFELSEVSNRQFGETEFRMYPDGSRSTRILRAVQIQITCKWFSASHEGDDLMDTFIESLTFPDITDKFAAIGLGYDGESQLTPQTWEEDGRERSAVVVETGWTYARERKPAGLQGSTIEGCTIVGGVNGGVIHSSAYRPTT